MNIEAEDLDVVLTDLVPDFFGVVLRKFLVFQDQLLALAGRGGAG